MPKRANDVPGNGDIQHIAQLLPDKHNARKHGERNLGMIERALGEVGAARSIVIDEMGTVLAGNGVVEAAAAAGIERVQVVDADGETIIAVRRRGLSEEQKRKLSLYDNRTGELADWNLDQLLAEVQSGLDLSGMWRAEELDKLLAGIVAPALPEPEAELMRADVPDAIWPSDNEWGVPLLDATMQAQALELPVESWGAIARKTRMRGTWAFYTSDDRFEALWTDPSPVVNTGAVNAVEPNFSCYSQMAPAFGLFQIYRKRWIARWWQAQGLRVFADLNVAEPFYALNMLGIPMGWKAWATRGYTARMEATEHEYELACERAGTTSILFLVYGGGKQVKALCQERGWLHIEEVMSRG